jgi:hypothetical protein
VDIPATAEQELGATRLEHFGWTAQAVEILYALQALARNPHPVAHNPPQPFSDSGFLFSKAR